MSLSVPLLIDTIILTLEILHRAAFILGVLYALDYAHNDKINLYQPKIKRLKKGVVYRLVMKLADKLESSLEARRRAWDYRAH